MNEKIEKGEIKEPFRSLCGVKPVSDKEWFEEKKKQASGFEEAGQEKIKPQAGQKKEKTEIEKIIPKPELEKKKGEEAEKSINIVFGRIQDEIDRFKPEKMDDKEKERLKNQIKIILKEGIFKDFKNIKGIQLWEQLSKKEMLEMFSVTILELKGKILLKYGDSSNIMKVFKNAVNETEKEVQIIFT